MFWRGPNMKDRLVWNERLTDQTSYGHFGKEWVSTNDPNFWPFPDTIPIIHIFTACVYVCVYAHICPSHILSIECQKMLANNFPNKKNVYIELLYTEKFEIYKYIKICVCVYIWTYLCPCMQPVWVFCSYYKKSLQSCWLKTTREMCKITNAFPLFLEGKG